MDTANVSHHGRCTAYRKSEPSPVAVAVHGAAMTGHVWDPMGDRGLGLAAIDLSGRGDSTDIAADPGWETLSAYASDSLAVARQLDTAVLIGHAMGAAVGLHIAAHRAHPFDAFVLIGVGARLPIAEDMRELAVRDVDGLCEYLLQPERTLARPNTGTRTTIERAMRGITPDVATRDLETCHRFTAPPPESIDVPTLVLCGAEDGLAPPDANEKLASRFPRGHFSVIPDAAHCPLVERPDATTDRVQSFLATVA